MIGDSISALHGIDWDNLEQTAATSSAVLEQLAADPDLVQQAMGSARDDEHLRELCEHYDILDKVVLYDDPAGLFRIRLHVFRPGYFDRPHNHRWTYSSRVLSGAYRHFIYAATDESSDEPTDLSALEPTMIRVERPGSAYTLHHSAVHSVVAEPWTISLIVRGPARKDRFFVTDKATGRAWWQYGAKDESVEERLAKQMSDSQIAEVITLVGESLNGVPLAAAGR